MDSATRPRLSLLVALLAMLSSGAMLYFGTGLQPVWWLTWLALLPALVAVHRCGRLAGVALCLGTWLIAGANLWPYLHGTLSLPAPLVLLAIASPGVQFALAAWTSRTLARAGRIMLAVLALPAVWVAIDYLQSIASPHGTFGNLAYSQLDFLPVVQLASLTGLWGVDFMLMLVPSALAVLAAYPMRRPTRMGVVLGTALACVLTLAFGTWRLSRPDGEPTRVVLITSNNPSFPMPMDDAASQSMLAAAESTIQSAGAQHPQIIVLPETIVVLDATSYPRFAQRFQGLARTSGATIVVGVDLKDGRDERNIALVFSPGGEPVARYAKQHLLLPFEARYQPGDALLMRSAPNATWGVAICKDMDFPALSRAYSKGGAQLMVVAAWDFVLDGRQHARMAVMRGIEGGFAVVRSARGGRMTVSDAHGRVLAEQTSSAAVTSMVENAATGDGNTLYSLFGDWFAWLALAAAASCVLFALVPAKQKVC
jgi:apolipoprotein N-acyltransferase